ncbi:GNAT family N-acetyltransferase [Sporolactobacillus shoreicorticis]|uniref:GNAT family N-acetyltransferase n=1 Tax=Sporolactobacillus shoreicorticis TaxID=1923877 RepID=A0ABW5S169_9BACL|nr:GNAT family N-acetyltransferase [Sporolactobacillus shoreicorticis]MCO7124576.1 GNAT family N-acetyltransferase [Sporolactobacillus shoreicorticis]
MEIRLMQTEDYAEVHQLWAHTDGMGMRSLDDSAQGIEKFLKRNPKTNFIAEENQTIVGVILCGNDGRRGYIYHTAVDSNYRRLGIGQQLVNAVINALREEDINKVALVVYATNQTGNAFWQSIGFTKREDLIYRNLSINEKNI